MKHLLLDIEGTTTPISFVYEILFPFAKEHLRDFLAKNGEQEDVVETIKMLDSDAQIDEQNDLETPRLRPAASNLEQAADAADIAECLMSRDRKATGLKRLQGQVWKSGYESGAIEGQLYADVAAWIRRWNEQGLPVSIYSSGSIEAQKLLFRYSQAGDLTPCLSRYFDTTTGSKKRSESYQRIARELELKPGEITFCTDVLDEARAANAAGMNVLVSVRPGNPDLESHPFHEIRSFAELDESMQNA